MKLNLNLCCRRYECKDGKNPDVKFKQLVVRYTSINHIYSTVLCCLCPIGPRSILAETPRKGPTGKAGGDTRGQDSTKTTYSSLRQGMVKAMARNLKSG